MADAVVKKEDSDDDIPLAALKKDFKSEVKDESESDDDIPLADLKKQAAMAPPRRAASMKKAPAPAPAPVKKETKKRKAPSKAPTPKKKPKKKIVKKKSTPKTKTTAKADSILNPIKTINGSKKGGLVSSLLLRWWYVIDYPTEKDCDSPGSAYYKLEGIRGVHVAVNGDSLGKVVDTRKSDSRPSLRNLFINFTSADLKEKLLEAYEKQIAELVEHEGEGTALQKNLKKEMDKWKKFNVNTADKEANKLIDKVKR